MGTPPAPAQTGGFDVTPTKLYGVAGTVVLHQDKLDKAAKDFIYEIVEYMDCGGYGASAEAVSTAYVKVGNKFLDTLARTVAGVGGVATGFVTTANNYARAEAASHPSGSAQPVQFPLPKVIDTPPTYQRIVDLKWGDMDDYSTGLTSWLLEGVPDFALDIIRGLLNKVYRWGEVADILPLPDYLQIDKLALAWLQPGFTITQVESDLQREVGTIADPNNGEWQAAMRQFTSSLWGTTAWGGSTAGYQWKHDTPGPQGTASHPVTTVLWDTTQEVSQALRAFAEAAETMRNEVWRIFKKAIWDALPHIKDGIGMDDVKKIGKGLLSMGKNLGIGITLEIDKGALNRAVAKYEGELLGVEARLNKLIPPLEEAYRAVPTYQAEQARAQAFGARSLNDFKPEHRFAVPGEDADNQFFPLDLTSQEGLYGSHPIDKHVGLTDDQLRMRLRDQSGAPSASTFTDLESGQRYTQAVLNDVDNVQRIEKWIEGVKQKDANPQLPNFDPNRSELQPPLYLQFPGETVGRGVTRDDYTADGMNAKAEDRNTVQVRLIYKEDLDPPFIVLTAMPHEGPKP
ncbi:RNase A-like domain-containing protein [Streptomyces sp. NPDC015346]|uniref:RNase A-like domain-containing protein n=1 Tax=Streptomyces sp. NPDC015346 TaxID=3364954 RepID=UPI0037001F22